MLETPRLLDDNYIDLCHQYGISIAEAQMSLLE